MFSSRQLKCHISGSIFLLGVKFVLFTFGRYHCSQTKITGLKMPYNEIHVIMLHSYYPHVHTVYNIYTHSVPVNYKSIINVFSLYLSGNVGLISSGNITIRPVPLCEIVLVCKPSQVEHTSQLSLFSTGTPANLGSLMLLHWSGQKETHSILVCPSLQRMQLLISLVFQQSSFLGSICRRRKELV